MTRFCTNAQDDFSSGLERNERSFKKNATRERTASSEIKECFTEYSLEDKVQALRNTLVHNEKHVENPTPSRNTWNLKKVHGVKECLQAEQKTPFQTIVAELKNTVMKSYWNKEVGKTTYQVSNLPVGMDPLTTTFGKTIEPQGTVAEILRPKTVETSEQSGRSPDDWEPGAQTNRNYEKPFDKSAVFGRSSKRNFEGSRTKRLLSWINCDPLTLVDRGQADFLLRTRSRVGEARNNDRARTHIDTVYGKVIKKESYGATKALYDCPVTKEAILQQKYLEHLNTLRQRIKKKQIPDSLFLDIQQELSYLDQAYTEFLPEDTVFGVLDKYQMYTDRRLFGSLLDILEIRKEGNVNYRKVVDLLNWKCDFPTLPKMNKIPLECQHYTTTYNETIGSEQKSDTNVRAAGIPSTRWDLPYVVIPRDGALCDKEHLGDQTSAFSLIFPSVFTRHGLSHRDFLQKRGKEEIRSIFENIGVKFPDDSFDRIWNEGLKRDKADGVCVETFRNILSGLSSNAEEHE